MAYLTSTDPQDYAQLLAADDPRDFSGHTPCGVLSPAPGCHTVLIGLGGMGVRTLDRLKGVLAARFVPGWSGHVTFLAADTDRSDLMKAQDLAPSETLWMPQPPNSSCAWPAIADEKTIRSVFNPTFPNRDCSRLAGRLTLHGRSLEDFCDAEIVARLRRIPDSLKTPVSRWQVYIIGSLHGSTGSGMFLDLPSLVRHALESCQPEIHAILYLPDQRTSAPRHQLKQHDANTYAALTELDACLHRFAREGHRESFPYSDPDQPELELSSKDGLFRSIRLVTTSMDPAGTQLNDVCGFLTAAIESAPVPGDPVPPPFGENGRRCFYSTICFSQAALPVELLRARAIGQLCERAGLIPVPDETQAGHRSLGEEPLPFLTEHPFKDAAAFSSHVRELCELPLKLMERLLRPDFSYRAVFDREPELRDLCSGMAESPAIRQQTDEEISRRTNAEAAQMLEAEMRQCFLQFRKKVREYVFHYGPRAYCDLFEGRVLSDPSGAQAPGIRDHLCMLRDDRNPAFRIRSQYTVQNTRAALDRVSEEIADRKNRLLLFPGSRRELCERWLHTYEIWVRSRILEGRIRLLLGPDGILDRCFLKPARELAGQLSAFAEVVGTLGSAYRARGVLSEESDRSAWKCTAKNDINSDIPLIRIFPGLRQYMDRLLTAGPPMVLREILVRDFFTDPERWLKIDDKASHYLPVPAAPIGARIAFDRCIRDVLPPLPVSIRDLFRWAATDGWREDFFASRLLSELAFSAPVSRVTMHPADDQVELVYPSELPNTQPQLALALEDAARALFPAVRFRHSPDPCRILLNRGFGPFSLCAVTMLPEWEHAYRSLVLSGRMPGGASGNP